METTQEVFVDHDECTVKLARELNSSILAERCKKDYADSCTTRIIGFAGEECGRLGYNQDNTFTKNELLDPDLGSLFEDKFEDESKPNPAEFLERLCNTDIISVINTLSYMEKSWICYSSIVPPRYTNTAKKLWEFVSEEGTQHVKNLYGDLKSKEFEDTGNRFFG